MSKVSFGIVGLGTMGSNFLVNVAKSGESVVGYDVDVEKVDAVLRQANGMDLSATDSLKEFFKRLQAPRSVMLFVPAHLVDQAIEDCIPFLEKGDLIIDGGNSHFPDTERRGELVRKAGGEFLGVGVSGGEEGARNGACIMVGGQPGSFARVERIFAGAAAKVDANACLAHVGTGSSGHFVKMVHNGIEYGMMQILCEAYDFMHRVIGMNAAEMSEVFEVWNRGRLSSFLVEITAQILRKNDAETGRPLVDMILDKAAQKGTGKWTSQAAMDFGVPIPTIDCAVTMRQISALKQYRVAIAEGLKSHATHQAEKAEALTRLERAVFGAFLSTYAQGFALISTASSEKDYGVNLAELARIWRGGCIIRSQMLELIRDSYAAEPGLANLLLSGKTAPIVAECLMGWRKAVADFVSTGVPCLGLSSALNYVEAMSCERLPANLLQAQRDLFGAHTYERVDREGSFHTEDWK